MSTLGRVVLLVAAVLFDRAAAATPPPTSLPGLSHLQIMRAIYPAWSPKTKRTGKQSTY